MVADATAIGTRCACSASGGRDGTSMRRSIGVGSTIRVTGAPGRSATCVLPPVARFAVRLGSIRAIGARRAEPSMTVNGPWTRTTSSAALDTLGRRATGSRMSSPHHGHSVSQPSVGAAQLQHRPGGATWRSARAAGPRIAPKMPHVPGCRRRRIANHAAATPNPTSHAATMAVMKRLMPDYLRGGCAPRRVPQRVASPLASYGTASCQVTRLDIHPVDGRRASFGAGRHREVATRTSRRAVPRGPRRRRGRGSEEPSAGRLASRRGSETSRNASAARA